MATDPLLACLALDFKPHEATNMIAMQSCTLPGDASASSSPGLKCVFSGLLFLLAMAFNLVAFCY